MIFKKIFSYFSPILKFLLLFFILLQLVIILMLSWWKFQPVHGSMFMLTYRLTNNNPAVKHEWVNDSEISSYIKKAVITSEDARFFQHNGFDWKGISQAIEKNERKGKIVSGGSSITQQLAKNLFLFKHKSYLRKFQESIITFYIEKIWAKDRILEVYLNTVEFGKGIYGVESASQHYFKKSAKKLSLDQSVKLVALLPNPKFYQNNLNSKHLNKRKARIRRYIHSTYLPD